MLQMDLFVLLHVKLKDERFMLVYFLHAVNGSCTVPDECICFPNWGGPLCDIGKCEVLICILYTVKRIPSLLVYLS